MTNATDKALNATDIKRPHTLASIATDADVTKRTVQRWLTKAGDIGVLDGDTRYFSDAERDTLLSHQSKRQANDTVATEPATLPTTPAEIQIYEGNHQQTLAPIDMTGARDLGQLRSPFMEIQSYQDPLAMAQQLVSQNSQFVGAMSADLQQRQEQLNRTNEALALVEQSNQNLLHQAQQYQIESRVQAALINQSTVQLQQKINQQQGLGKPVSGQSQDVSQ